jgi:hypothetical protein
VADYLYDAASGLPQPCPAGSYTLDLRPIANASSCQSCPAGTDRNRTSDANSTCSASHAVQCTPLCLCMLLRGTRVQLLLLSMSSARRLGCCRMVFQRFNECNRAVPCWNICQCPTELGGRASWMHPMPQRHDYAEFHCQHCLRCVSTLRLSEGADACFECSAPPQSRRPHLTSPHPTQCIAGLVQPGYLFNPNSLAAEPCPVNTYASGYRPSVNATSCVPCGPGLSTNGNTGQSDCGE